MSVKPPLMHVRGSLTGDKYLCGQKTKSWPEKYLESDRYLHEIKACPECKKRETNPEYYPHIIFPDEDYEKVRLKGFDEIFKRDYGDAWDDWDKWVLIHYWSGGLDPATSGSKHANNWIEVIESIENKGRRGEAWQKPADMKVKVNEEYIKHEHDDSEKQEERLFLIDFKQS